MADNKFLRYSTADSRASVTIEDEVGGGAIHEERNTDSELARRGKGHIVAEAKGGESDRKQVYEVHGRAPRRRHQVVAEAAPANRRSTLRWFCPPSAIEFIEEHYLGHEAGLSSQLASGLGYDV